MRPSSYLHLFRHTFDCPKLKSCIPVIEAAYPNVERLDAYVVRFREVLKWHRRSLLFIIRDPRHYFRISMSW